MSFTLQKLTEGIRDRHVGQQNKRLVEKWSRTGLLRGMEETNRENMATLLENQAAQVLRESNTMGSGEVGGFTNIAFPIVRRVFGGLVANELVSIQPMSLPSGLLFYLDYTYGSDNGPYEKGDSIYGSPNGRAIQNGADAVGGQYDLVGSGFSKIHTRLQNAEDPVVVLNGAVDDGVVAAKASNAVGVAAILERIGLSTAVATLNTFTPGAVARKLDPTDADHLALIGYDSALVDAMNAGKEFVPAIIDISSATFKGMDSSLANALSIELVHQGQAAAAADRLSKFVSDSIQSGTSHNVRRLTRLGTLDASNKFVANAQVNVGVPADGAVALVILETDATNFLDFSASAQNAIDAFLTRLTFVAADQVNIEATSGPGFGQTEALNGMPFEGDGNGSPVIPEIDIKIESIPVTAQTRKLRARWSPELAQDLNAYHSMDAEVELTQILSEQIALEIDREILGDLLTGAQGANFFWSRSPGKFVNKRTGAEVARTSTLNPGPAFTGTVREWYETLTETVIDVANEIHRKTLRGSANFIVVSPDVATILEASVLYRPSYSIDGDGQVGAPFTMGAEKIGSLSNRFTVYKDPYFPRNKILVGYKGGSYLETGFVYAPYVPLIVTPTIFQPDDFTPRKGVMTRYGKKMVRSDFYGTVTCLDMNII